MKNRDKKYQKFEGNILLITTEYPPTFGGGGTFVYHLGNALSKLNIETHILVGRKGRVSETHSPKKNLHLHSVRMTGNSQLAVSESLLEKALSLTRKINPSVIHGNHFDGVLLSLCVKKSFNIPCLATLHKTPLLRFDETLIRRRAYYSYFNFISKLDVDVFVAGSNVFYEELVKFGVSDTKLRKIYHGVPIIGEERDVKIDTIPDFKDKILILCPSRLDGRKRLDLFIKSCGMLKSKLKNPDLKFLITGNAETESEKKYKKELEYIAGENGLIINDDLFFRTFDYQKMPSLYYSSKVTVLPSEREGLGLSLLESMAVGTPVIASNTIGINEVVSTEQNGLLFNVGDEDDLTYQLSRALSEDGLYDKLKEGCIKTIKEKFHYLTMASKYLNIYSEIIEK